MISFLKKATIALVGLLLLDSLWLGIFAKQFYHQFLGYLMAPEANLIPAILFYLFYACAIVWFIVNPKLKSGNGGGVFFQGAFFGFIVYAAYDLTNHAIIKQWPWQVTVIDMLWGTVLTAIVSTFVFFIFKGKSLRK